ncbi:YggT family protein [Acidovorax sp. GBBC 3334]|uniref:YggT family protein n=1 Tax=unclassified Acidovorax TaxID=2684926 RepID=UPI002302E45D|nr:MULTISPECIES: YggT family protein [unclassified Acidovorax]MDA8454604.1 YggT family protein [Acidovorax sp. GBBC 3334]MDA8519719.1 YggT family protein [Acidovorax sp. NCPPB 4044]
MLFQIASFLLDVVGGLLTGACLLRLYMQAQRVPFGNPIGRLVFALSDWLVMPLRRIIPPTGRWDWSSLVAALLIQLLQYLLLWALLGGAMGLAWLPWLAVFGMARVAVTGMMGLLIVAAVLSWVQTQSPIADVIARLCDPVLRPLRRVIPLLGGVDLSPLVAIVALQVVMIVLGHLQAAVL